MSREKVSHFGSHSHIIDRPGIMLYDMMSHTAETFNTTSVEPSTPDGDESCSLLYAKGGDWFLDKFAECHSFSSHQNQQNSFLSVHGRENFPHPINGMSKNTRQCQALVKLIIDFSFF